MEQARVRLDEDDAGFFRLICPECGNVIAERLSSERAAIWNACLATEHAKECFRRTKEGER